MAKTHQDFNGATYETIEIKRIVIPAFQRDLSEGWANDLAEGWQARLFRPVTVARLSDGDYSCIDGMHTVESAVRRGHTHIPALVYDGLTYEEQSAMFSDLNSQRRKPEAFDLWFADHEAGREWALTLKSIADQFDLRVAKGGTDPRNLRAIAAVRELIKKGQADVVVEALDILTSVYDVDGPYNRSRVERALIGGMVDLITRAQGVGLYDKAAMKRRLARASFRFHGDSVPVTPDGFQNYLNSLIASGAIVVPALNSGSGQSRIYGRAFALASLGRDAAGKVYG